MRIVEGPGLTARPGEIGPEPIEEHRGVAYMGKDIGAHYLFHHGGVAPDYAIAAEGCDFGLTWVGCGYAVFRFLAEFAREPDAFLGTLGFGLTMGQWLSLPMAAIGVAMIAAAMRRPVEAAPR